MAPITFADDAGLGYLAARTRLGPGDPLRLDESYRLAHLPLLRPDHPAAILDPEGDAVGRRFRWLPVLVPRDLVGEDRQVVLVAPPPAEGKTPAG